MEYPNYYYEQNDRQEQPQNPPPRRGIGGYIVTAVVFTIIGALLATILMPSLYEIAGSDPNPGTAAGGNGTACLYAKSDDTPNAGTEWRKPGHRKRGESHPGYCGAGQRRCFGCN